MLNDYLMSYNSDFFVYLFIFLIYAEVFQDSNNNIRFYKKFLCFSGVSSWVCTILPVIWGSLL